MTGDETGRQFVYDAWNRLVTVKNSGGTTLETFSYDGLNRRVTQTASGTTTDLYYSKDWQVLEEMVGGAATARYVWSPVYVNAMVLRDFATGSPGTLNQRLWVQQDANWNVTALVNGSGAVVERDVYSPFGVVSVYSASWSSLGSSAYSWTIGYQGMRFDSLSGFNAADERWYSPTLQRWSSIDPERFGAGDVDLYRFVGNRPTNATDPSGLEPPTLGTLPGWGVPPMNNNGLFQAVLKRSLADALTGKGTTAGTGLINVLGRAVRLPLHPDDVAQLQKLANGSYDFAFDNYELRVYIHQLARARLIENALYVFLYGVKSTSTTFGQVLTMIGIPAAIQPAIPNPASFFSIVSATQLFAQQLGNEDWRIREAATRALQGLTNGIVRSRDVQDAYIFVATLRQLQNATQDPEVKTRIQTILDVGFSAIVVKKMAEVHQNLVGQQLGSLMTVGNVTPASVTSLGSIPDPVPVSKPAPPAKDE
jgi:RHS repeat-associated protein